VTETVQQYIARLLGNVGTADPRQILDSTPGRLRELTAGRDGAELARKPGPDRWSVAQILAHLADSEVASGWRLRSILAANGSPLQAYDQNRWAEEFRYDQVPAAESLDAFQAARRATMRVLRAVDPALLSNHGIHSERGKETVEHLIRLIAGHDLNHLQQVERLLAGVQG
jgi:hypothetical protein